MAAYASAALGRTVDIPLSVDGPVYRRGVLGLADLDIADASSVRARGLFGLAATKLPAGGS